MAAAIPRTKRILKILEPMTFPRAISTSFLRAATIEVTSSGNDVPIATIVSPIKFWLKPNAAAIADALSTTMSPPNAMAAAPPTMYTRQSHTGIGFARSISSASSEASVVIPAVLAFNAERTIQNMKRAKKINKITPSILPTLIPM